MVVGPALAGTTVEPVVIDVYQGDSVTRGTAPAGFPAEDAEGGLLSV